MPGITIRFSERTYQLVRTEARAEGISITQYIREAALLRAWVGRIERERPDLTSETAEIRAWLEAQDGRRKG